MLKSLHINGFKSFGNKSDLTFDAPISAIVGPNGSGKSNSAEAFRFVLGEQSLKALRAKNSDELLFNGGHEGRRRNRASVKAVFDNTNDELDIEYDEVEVERIVERGDASTYRINGSNVRLKDVTDLLSDANIGTSRHHIISQGEADKILSVHEKERKSMIEDALGLRRFYRRRREALQKLQRTESNLTDIKAFRRQLQPELDYLEKQISRIEKTKKLRGDLTEKYQEYFKREAVLLEAKDDELKEKHRELAEAETRLKEEVAEARKKVKQRTQGEKGRQTTTTSGEKLNAVEKKITKISQKINDVSGQLGQVSGKLETLKRASQNSEDTESRISIKNSLFVEHKKSFDTLLSQVDAADDNEKKLSLFGKITTALEDFLDDLRESGNHSNTANHSTEITELEKEKITLGEKHEKLRETQSDLEKQKTDLTKAKEEETQELHATEKRLLELEAALESTTDKRELAENKQESLEEENQELADEKSEARILCGPGALETDKAKLLDSQGQPVSQEELLESNTRSRRRAFRRNLERLKITLENTRVSNQKSVKNEYERVSTQADFLDGEVADLHESAQSLRTLIDDIESTVAEKFDTGISAINKAFKEFFSTMFGGGRAELFLTEHPEGSRMRVEDVDEDPKETERGVGIKVELPKKKVRGLDVLSGGERALVSIALLFALSQITPPPFIVLDEADAALDEANSRRFGDMIESLSKRSQLIVITHNRETMSRADVLYGVTMDQIGASRLLSLEFSEAVEAVED